MRPSPAALGGASPAIRYALALVVAGAVLALSTLFESRGDEAVLTFSVALVALTALRAGTGPGLLATALLGVAFGVFFEPAGEVLPGATSNRARLIGFLLGGALTAVIAGAHRSSRIALARAAEGAMARRARAQGILESIRDGFFAVDARGRTTYVNPAAEGLQGKPAAEPIGRELFDAWPQLRGTRFEQTYREAMETRRVTQAEDRFSTSGCWLEFIAYPGTDGGLAVLVRDVTARKESEERLREREALLREAQRLADLGSWDLDLEAGGAVFSEQLFRIAGLEPRPARLTREEVLSVIHPDDRPAFESAVAGFAEGRAAEAEFRIVRPDGTVRNALLRGEPVAAAGERPRRAIGITSDITERRDAERRLAESERLFRLLAENSRDVVFRVRARPPHGFDYISPSVLALTGYTPEEHYADPQIEERVVGAEELAAMRALLVEGFHGTRLEQRWRRRDGTLIWVEQQVSAVRDERGELVAVEGMARDVTARKEAEARLREADRRKDEFLAVLSHELRNPLAPIRNSLFILSRADPASETAVRALAVIDRQVGHLARLVDDLLDVTRIARGKLQLRREPVDLREVVRRTAEDHRTVFADRGIEVTVELPPAPVWLDGDATRLAQAVGNLLQNSAKFTPDGGHVSIGLAHEGDGAVLRVRDDGVGIEPELLGRLFVPFAQADRTLARSSGGLGLGLALVRGVAELHGGTAEARSAGPGAGAEFTIRLPARTAPADAAAERPAPAPARGRKVLVIEDNADAAESLKAVLELDGHDVEVAHDGPAGIDAARRHHPQVVLCDIGLPELDGYGVARAFRADPALKDVELVALTGYASPEDRRRASEAGFDEHLAKPPDLDQLERIVGGEGAPPP